MKSDVTFRSINSGPGKIIKVDGPIDPSNPSIIAKLVDENGTTITFDKTSLLWLYHNVILPSGVIDESPQ